LEEDNASGGGSLEHENTAVDVHFTVHFREEIDFDAGVLRSLLPTSSGIGQGGDNASDESLDSVWNHVIQPSETKSNNCTCTCHFLPSFSCRKACVSSDSKWELPVFVCSTPPCAADGCLLCAVTPGILGCSELHGCLLGYPVQRERQNDA
jgi:hypothetical protein